jgi:hypothetical protein
MTPETTARQCAREGCPNQFVPARRAGQRRLFCGNSCKAKSHRDRRAAGGTRRRTDPAREDGFAAALHAGWKSSGMTLEAIAESLERRGLPASTATLSNWQKGTSRPRVTPDNARRLLALERILDIDTGQLLRPWQQRATERQRVAASMSPPPARQTASRSLATALVADRRRWLEDAIAARGGGPSRNGLICTYQEEHYVVGENRWPRRSRITLDLCAIQPGIRSYWYLSAHAATASAQDVIPAAGCRLGRTISEADYRRRIDDPEILTATELVLAEPLEPYAPSRISFTVAHSFAPPPGKLPDCHFRRIVTKHACRRLRLVISFNAHDVPARLYRATWPGDNYDSARLVPVEGDLDELVVDNPAPGGYGWKWQWPAADEPRRTANRIQPYPEPSSRPTRALLSAI